jgi:hypothetical protein
MRGVKPLLSPIPRSTRIASASLTRSSAASQRHLEQLSSLDVSARSSSAAHARAAPFLNAAWTFCLLMLGCSGSPQAVTSSQTGDLGLFVLQSVECHGGRAKVTNGLPQLAASWSYEVISNAEYLAGREEVHVHLAPEQFTALTNYLSRAFGEPSNPATISHDGGLHGYYTIQDIGVALQFYQDRRESGVILVGERKR